MVFGEQGNSERNWDARSALRMRLRAWTAFFREGVLVFWNMSSLKTTVDIGVAANIYLGPEERGYVRVLQQVARGVDRHALPVAAVVSAPDLVRAYALRSSVDYALYLHAYTNHTTPTTGIHVTVDLLAGGTATWIDPATGNVVGTPAVVEPGSRTLNVPSFTTDIALTVEGP